MRAARRPAASRRGAQMGRRLTLVPGAMTWLSVGVSDVLEVSDEEGDQEGRRKSSSPGSIQVGMKGKVARNFSAPSKGFREEFSGAAKPKTFGSRFWALGDVSDATDSESKGEKDAATSVEEAFPEARFVRRALAEGFTVDEVLKAGKHLLLNPAATLGSCTKSTNLKGNGLLARRIVDSVAKRRKSSIKPRKGPLPRARISQPLTIGDKLDEAFTAKLSNSVKFRKAWVPIATRQENEATLSRERDESCAGLREEDDKEVFLATEEERRELIFGSTTGQLETRQPRGVEEFGRFPVSRFKLKKDSGPSKQFYLGSGHKVQIKFHFGAGQLLSWAGQHERVKKRLG